VDSNPVCYNLDPAQIESKVTARTKAVMPVHLYGQCAEMDKIMEISRSNGIPVIEDAAQAIGAEYKIAAREQWARSAASHFFRRRISVRSAMPDSSR
jgi:dTDP-4-amino-4,6-dideoxygalactose transaminase